MGGSYHPSQRKFMTDMGRTKTFLVTKVLKLGSPLSLCIMWVVGHIIAANS